MGVLRHFYIHFLTSICRSQFSDIFHSAKNPAGVDRTSFEMVHFKLFRALSKDFRGRVVPVSHEQRCANWCTAVQLFSCMAFEIEIFVRSVFKLGFCCEHCFFFDFYPLGRAVCHFLGRTNFKICYFSSKIEFPSIRTRYALVGEKERIHIFSKRSEFD